MRTRVKLILPPIAAKWPYHREFGGLEFEAEGEDERLIDRHLDSAISMAYGKDWRISRPERAVDDAWERNRQESTEALKETE